MQVLRWKKAGQTVLSCLNARGENTFFLSCIVTQWKRRHFTIVFYDICKILLEFCTNLQQNLALRRSLVVPQRVIESCSLLFCVGVRLLRHINSSHCVMWTAGTIKLSQTSGAGDTCGETTAAAGPWEGFTEKEWKRLCFCRNVGFDMNAAQEAAVYSGHQTASRGTCRPREKSKESQMKPK